MVAHRQAEPEAAVSRPSTRRIAWVDYAKGWCIVLVVAMHSALGVGLAMGETGWLHPLVAFAKPFRIPDFFLVSGLFVGSAIDLPWRSFLDRRWVHFFYFYALWLLIVLAVKAGGLGILQPGAFVREYLFAFVEPFSSMWFIYILPFMFVTAKLMRGWPVALALALAGGLHLIAAWFPGGGHYAMTSVMTGWTAPDSYCLFLVYFLAGHYFRTRLFTLAQAASTRPMVCAAGLLAWALVEQIGVQTGWSEVPGLTLAFGLAGGLAVVALSAWMAQWHFAPWLAYCGQRSLVIYTAFVLPMAAMRLLLLRTGVVTDVGMISIITALAGIGAPLVLAALCRGSALSFLFERPGWARLRTSVASPQPRAQSTRAQHLVEPEVPGIKANAQDQQT